MHSLQLRQEGTFCITKASPAQGAGLVVASSFSLDGAMTPLLAAFTPSAGKPVPRGGKREKRKELCTAVLGTHPAHAEEGLLLLSAPSLYALMHKMA